MRKTKTMNPAKKPIGYILIFIDSEDSQDIQDAIASIVDIGEQEAMIEDIAGSLIRILIGVPLPRTEPDKAIQKTVRRLVSIIGPKVSIIYGTTSCPVGIVGTEKRKSYTALIPKYRQILQRLVSMPVGTVEEWTA